MASVTCEDLGGAPALKEELVYSGYVDGEGPRNDSRVAGLESSFASLAQQCCEGK